MSDRLTPDDLAAPADAEYARKGVCLLCGGAVLHGGHIDPDRHAAEVERITSGSRSAPSGGERRRDVTGKVSAPRGVVRTVEALQGLPAGTVLRMSGWGYLVERTSLAGVEISGHFVSFASLGSDYFPMVILHVPGET